MAGEKQITGKAGFAFRDHQSPAFNVHSIMGKRWS